MVRGRAWATAGNTVLAAPNPKDRTHSAPANTAGNTMTSRVFGKLVKSFKGRMSLLIKNGEIVTADSRTQADIWVEDQTITRIGKDLEAPTGSQVVDATGKYVFPGFIDPHVHIYLPFMATFAKDTHETASIASLIGGTTTYIEMCCPNRNDDALEGYHLWKSKAEGSSACDYSFHMSVTRFDGNTEAQLREIVSDGIASFKIFLAYKNFFGVDEKAGRHHYGPLRERGTGWTAAAIACGARQDRTRIS
jgi:hypothetical protein